ncbi:MAG: hypothetical protein AAF958_06125 [Planctomycetota bacterium]
MSDILAEPVTRVVLGLVVLCVLVAAAYFVVSIFRDYGDDVHLDPDQMLSNLEEMRQRGDISEEEFRTIQASNRADVDASPSTSSDGSP